MASPPTLTGSASISPRRPPQHGRHAPAVGFHGAKVGEAVGIVSRVTYAIAVDEAAGATGPTCGDDDGAVPESRTGQVEVRRADRCALGHLGRHMHRAGRRRGECVRRPSGRLDMDASSVEREHEEPATVRCVRGDERLIDNRASAAKLLRAGQPPPPRDRGRFHPTAGALRGPYRERALGDFGAAGFGTDRQRVDVRLYQSCH